MRIRSIKPEFWRSDDIASLDWETRLLFIGLWSYVDDNGVGRDEERLLRADLFPLEDDPRETLATISRGLQELSRRGLILRYEVEKRRFLEIESWARHQRIDKPNKERYPRFDRDRGTLAEPSRDTRETLAPGTEEQGNRGTGDQGAGSSAPSPRDISSAFDAAWTHWPKKVEKKASLEKFKQAIKKLPLPELVEHITVFGQRYAETTDRQFVPALDAWLNGERWTDELPEAPRRQNAPQRLTRADENALEFERLYGGDQHGGTRSVQALDAGFGS